MGIQIKTPIHLHEKGRRDNNEDFLYPPIGKASTQDRLFMVCDGVGGSAKGEVASQLACNSFVDYFKQYPIDYPDELYLEQALTFVEGKFDQYLLENPDAHGMGTTLTLLFLYSEGVVYAHIGDSRIYLIREHKPIPLTSDHTLVNELVKAKVLTPEEAKDHPQRNVITRAIQGARVSKTKIEVNRLADVQAGDYFLMCSDGILEGVDEAALTQIFSVAKSDQEVIDSIKQRCLLDAKDNFTAYLIPVETVKAMPVASEIVPPIEPSQPDAPNKRFKLTDYLYVPLLVFLAFMILKNLFTPNAEPPTPENPSAPPYTAKYQQITELTYPKNWVKVKQGKLWGIIINSGKNSGKIIFAPKFTRIEDFHPQYKLARVFGQEERFGYINDQGVLIIDTVYNRIRSGLSESGFQLIRADDGTVDPFDISGKKIPKEENPNPAGNGQ